MKIGRRLNTLYLLYHDSMASCPSLPQEISRTAVIRGMNFKIAFFVMGLLLK